MRCEDTILANLGSKLPHALAFSQDALEKPLAEISSVGSGVVEEYGNQAIIADECMPLTPLTASVIIWPFRC